MTGTCACRLAHAHTPFRITPYSPILDPTTHSHLCYMYVSQWLDLVSSSQWGEAETAMIQQAKENLP